MCSNHSITINNYSNNENVSHSYVLLKGTVLTNFSSKCSKIKKDLIINIGVRFFTVQLYFNKFKSLVELERGQNRIGLTYCCHHFEIQLTYKPRSTDFCVVPLYIICKNHPGNFQAPENVISTPQSACKRIANGLKLIQSLIAEKFYDSGLLRKTFQLESDLNPSSPNCRLFESELDHNLARSMSQNDLWTYFGTEILNSNLKNDNFKYLGFISCTRYRGDKFSSDIINHNDILGITEAYVALGGGGLALFGSACLYTWPESIEHIFEAFLNSEIIDKTKFMDDSCYRGTKGACFATTLGSVLHELCHTFDLGHTENGVMGRGFDNIDKEYIFENQIQKKPQNINRVTTALNSDRVIKVTQNIVKKDTDKIKYVNPTILKTSIKNPENKGIFWTPNCSILLYNHKWFNSYEETKNFILEFRNSKTQIFSSLGLKIVEIRENNSENLVSWFDFSKNLESIFNVPKNLEYFEKNYLLIAQDCQGNILKENFINVKVLEPL